jgi:hypothetical protein
MRVFLVVQWYDPVQYLDNIHMQSYQLSDEEPEVIPANNLLRNVHVVPVWSSEIEDVSADNLDIYDQYSQFVINSQSDQAAWNYFY